MSCGVGQRRSSDLALLWLWCRSAATALIRSLAWEFPYATGVALKRQKKKKKKKKEKKSFFVSKEHQSEDTDSIKNNKVFGNKLNQGAERSVH